MSTITEIVTQIQRTLDSLDDIDQSSMSEYLPAVTTRRVALILPPLGMSGTVDAPVGLKTRLVHHIPCELWIKVTNGDMADCMNRGREICMRAATELIGTTLPSSALNGTVDFFGEGEGSNAFEWTIDDNIIKVGNANFMRALLRVTVTKRIVVSP